MAFSCLAVLLLWGANGTTQAQDTTHVHFRKKPAKRVRAYNRFSLDIGLGYSYGGSSEFSETCGPTYTFSDASGIVPFYIEPQLALSDRFAMGIRYELALVKPHGLEINGVRVRSFEADNSAYNILSFQTELFLVNKWPFRLGLGLGLGAYRQGKIEITDIRGGGGEFERNRASFAERSTIGISPRMRFQIWPVDLSLTYHATFGTEVYSLWILNVGMRIGGKKKE